MPDAQQAFYHRLQDWRCWLDVAARVVCPMAYTADPDIFQNRSRRRAPMPVAASLGGIGPTNFRRAQTLPTSPPLASWALLA